MSSQSPRMSEEFFVVVLIELLKKNYKSHLKSKHPEENLADLSVQGQRSMFDYLRRTSQVAEAINDTDSRAATDEEEEEEYNNMDCSLCRKSKRRHENECSASSSFDDGGEEKTKQQSFAPIDLSVENKIDFLTNEIYYLRGQVEKVEARSEQNARKKGSKKVATRIMWP